MRKRRVIVMGLGFMGLGFCSAIATIDAAPAPSSRRAKAETRADIISFLRGVK
jgi:hypothetical protein